MPCSTKLDPKSKRGKQHSSYALWTDCREEKRSRGRGQTINSSFQTPTSVPWWQWWFSWSGGGYGSTPPNAMSCINWNCHGLGQPRVVLELTELVKKKSPSIIFLMETKSKEQYLKKLCSKLKLENVHIEPRVNVGGGLALYWKNKIDLKVLDSTPTYIDTVVNPRMDDAWRLMGFYGNPKTANWEHS